MSKLRVGMIGAGHVHAPGKVAALMTMPQVELAGIYEPSPAERRRREGEKAFSQVRWLESAEAVLDDDAISAVIIETLPFDGLSRAQRALAAGKHVHLDKAPGTDFDAFAAAVELARRSNLRFQQGYHFPYTPGFAFLLKTVASGLLGEIQSIRGRLSSPRSMYDSLRPELQRSPGGMMYYLGCHLVEVIVRLLGRPQRVSAFLHRDYPVDPFVDNAVAVLEYPAALATVETSALQVRAFEKRRFEVYGTAGSLFLDSLEPAEVLLCLDQAAGGYAAGWQTVEVGNWPRYIPELTELFESILTGRPLSASPDHDLAVHQTLLRACDVLPDDG